MKGFCCGVEQTDFALNALDALLFIKIFIAQRWGFFRRHFPGEDKFAQHRAVVPGIGLAVDHFDAAAKTLFPQRRRTRSTCRTGTDNHERTCIVSRRDVRVGNRLLIHPNLIATQLQRITLEAVEGWRFTQSTVFSAKGCLVPRANQPPVAQRAVSQRRTGMRAFTLIRT